MPTNIDGSPDVTNPYATPSPLTATIADQINQKDFLQKIDKAAKTFGIVSPSQAFGVKDTLDGNRSGYQFLTEGQTGIYDAAVIGLPPPDSMNSQPYDPRYQYFLGKFNENLIEQITAKNSKMPISYFMEIIATNKVEALSPENKIILETAIVDATKETQMEWSIAQTRDFMEKVEGYLNSAKKAALKVANDLPSNDPAQLSIVSLVSIITSALGQLKQVLGKLQLDEFSISQKAGVAKKDGIDLRGIAWEKSFKEYQENQAIMEKQKESAEKAKDVGFIVSMVASAAMLVVSAITLNPALAVATVVMMAYSIADRELNLTGQAVEGFTKVIESLAPDEATRNWIKGIVVAVLVVALVVLLVTSGGGAAGAAASATTSGLTQIGKEVFKQLAIQFAMMFLISSQYVPDLIIGALIDSGDLDKEKDEQKIAMIKVGINAVLMLAMLAGSAKLGSLKSGGAKGIDQAKELSQSHIIDDLVGGIREMDPRRFPSLSLPEKVVYIRNFFQASNLIFQIYTSIYLGILSLDLAKLYERIGDTDKEIAAIGLLIKNLDNLIVLLSEDREKIAEFLKSIANTIDQVYALASDSSSKLAQFRA